MKHMVIRDPFEAPENTAKEIVEHPIAAMFNDRFTGTVEIDKNLDVSLRTDDGELAHIASYCRTHFDPPGYNNISYLSQSMMEMFSNSAVSARGSKDRTKYVVVDTLTFTADGTNHLDISNVEAILKFAERLGDRAEGELRKLQEGRVIEDMPPKILSAAKESKEIIEFINSQVSEALQADEPFKSMLFGDLDGSQSVNAKELASMLECSEWALEELNQRLEKAAPTNPAALVAAGAEAPAERHADGS